MNDHTMSHAVLGSTPRILAHPPYSTQSTTHCLPASLPSPSMTPSYPHYRHTHVPYHDAPQCIQHVTDARQHISLMGTLHQACFGVCPLLDVLPSTISPLNLQLSVA